TCVATMGELSNEDHMLEISGKAGRKRWLGRRPRVRGVAMNPVDHPMGGGEGRASGGHPRSRNGLLSKGYKTRRGKRQSDRMIIKRRKGSAMARSLKKGPFVEYTLEKKVDAQNEGAKKTVIKTWSRRSMITPDFVGHTFAVHNGNKFI